MGVAVPYIERWSQGIDVRCVTTGSAKISMTPWVIERINSRSRDASLIIHGCCWRSMEISPNATDALKIVVQIEKISGSGLP